MKLRASLAAAATATAVMVSGAAAADAAPTVNDTVESTSTESEKTTKTTQGGLSSSADEEGSSVEDLSPGEIKSWIAVITTVVGLLTQILSVASRFSR